MSQLSEDLRAAKVALLERGRCAKGAQNIKTGECCPIMAIAHGVYDNSRFTTTEERHRRNSACRIALFDALPKGLSPLDIILWNEDPETTDADVFAAFDRAIADEEEE